MVATSESLVSSLPVTATQAALQIANGSNNPWIRKTVGHPLYECLFYSLGGSSGNAVTTICSDGSHTLSGGLILFVDDRGIVVSALVSGSACGSAPGSVDS